jgi:hypothetical protein
MTSSNISIWMVGTIGHAFGEDGVELQERQILDPQQEIIGASINKNGDLPLYYFFNIAI